MINYIYNSCCSMFNVIKRCYITQTARFFICISIVVFGAVSALFKELPDVVNANFIYNICTYGDINPLAYIIRLCMLNIGLFIFAYMAIYHYCVFLLNMGILYTYSLIIFRIVYASILISPLYGLLFLIFYILPIVVVCLFAYITTILYVYELSGYVVNKRAKINVSVYTSNLIKVVGTRCAISTVFGIVLHLIIHIIVVFIVSM